MRRAVSLVVAPALALTLALTLAACGSSSDGSDDGNVTVSDASDDGYAGVLLPKPYPIPTTDLTTDAGKTWSWKQDTSGKLTLVFYGYINCPDICQVVMGTLASAYARLSDAQKKQVQVVFVTTDPARDDEQALRAYLDRLDPSFTGLTGSIDDIDASGKPFQVFIKKGAKLASGGYEVDHTTSVFAVDGHGTTPLVWVGTDSPAEVTADVKKLLAGGAADPTEEPTDSEKGS